MAFNVSWACGVTDSHFSSNQPHQTLFLFKQIISCVFGGTSSASLLPPAFQVKEVSTQHLSLLRVHPVPASGGSCDTLQNNGVSRHTQQTLLKGIPKTWGGGRQLSITTRNKIRGDSPPEKEPSRDKHGRGKNAEAHSHTGSLTWLSLKPTTQHTSLSLMPKYHPLV